MKNKIKGFINAVGAFLTWMWMYPTTPIENFYDAISRYKFETDPELIEIMKELEEMSKKID
jgi:hypothetical protein